ncbi:hypothetical protein HJC23_010397 [Cyclotella cryptica]|uniref:Uncharacterized protein n=1 Tax=Cyclotella cryptica TaxID=29204 RepID=A0ABD3QHQ9_9STRA|eukprot:CCRYP_005267-RA/>CCRYP_005267-RA protein AED:0.00 eAED:0.00 QI:208/-1/1/1/-1/1/1/19/236
MANICSLFVPSTDAPQSLHYDFQSVQWYTIQKHPRYYHHRGKYKRCLPLPRVQTKYPLEMNSFGLTDDGDFAILGVNMEDPDEEESDKTNNIGQALGGDISALLTGTIFDGKPSNIKSYSTGTPIDWQNVGAYSDVSSAGSSPQSFTVPDGMRRDNVNFSQDDEALKEIKELLLEIIPTLSPGDTDNYSIGLSNIGFHPKCVTMCELKYEDLDFMKVLHRRYFFNEVTGVEHPWEV